jgi:hypothetical protein
MIKRYNQFVKGVNEEFEMGEGQPSPITRPAPTTTPETPSRPRPSRPGITPTEIPSEEDAPLAYREEEEEGGEYIGQEMMADLASNLGAEVESDGSIDYNGKKVNFYSETEMFHVDKKKFKTPEEVVSYLDGSNNITTEEEEEMTDETGEIDEFEDDMDDFDMEDNEYEEFESKSYKRTFESYKRKK